MRRLRLALLLVPVAVMVVMTQIADALWPDLVTSAPDLLIALSSRNRYLVLVAGRIPEWEYYLIGTLRLLAPDPFLFALGWSYGPAALRWMERRTPTVGQIMRTVERWFVRFGHALVVLFPNNYVCLIAGASRMSPPLFFFLNLTGTVGRLVLVAIVGDVFQAPIDSVLDFIGRYRIPLLVLSVGIVALSALAEARRGRRELSGIRRLEEELEAEEARIRGDDTPGDGRLDGSRAGGSAVDDAAPATGAAMPPEEPPLSGPGRA